VADRPAAVGPSQACGASPTLFVGELAVVFPPPRIPLEPDLQLRRTLDPYYALASLEPALTISYTYVHTLPACTRGGVCRCKYRHELRAAPAKTLKTALTVRKVTKRSTPAPAEVRGASCNTRRAMLCNITSDTNMV
jgi:hypothetical protein